MTSSSVSVNASKANVILYHQNVNGSLQDRPFVQGVSQKAYKFKSNDKDFYTPPSSFSNSSPSNSPIIHRNTISNSPNPLTPTFRRASGGERNRGSMRKMLPALPDMDTQVFLFTYIYIYIYIYIFCTSWTNLHIHQHYLYL